MKPNSKVLENLQSALSMELAAALQYLLHAHVLEKWGLDQLVVEMREEMQEELGHADNYMNRIMFLNGSPQLTPAKTPQRSQTLKDMFEADLADEKGAIRFYTEAAEAAVAAGDIGTRTLFEKIVLDEEGHLAWLELQLDLLDRIGEQAYVAKNVTIARDTV